MKKLLSTPNLMSLACALLLALMPAAALAEEAPQAGMGALAPVLITEIQPGSSASASEEFIELYNTTTAAIDLAAYEWQLEIASSTASNWDSPHRVIQLAGIIEPGQSYLVASQFSSSGQQVQYLPDEAGAWFSAGITATAGHVRLTYSTHQPQDDACISVLTVVDQVEWSTPTNGLPSIPSPDGRAVYVTASSSGVPKAASLQRFTGQASPGTYVDTDNDMVDITVDAPSPGTLNSVTSTGATAGGALPVGVPADNCDPNPPADDELPSDPPTDEPPSRDDQSEDEEASGEVSPSAPANAGLLDVEISEVLPNPAPPQSDDIGEFIELYNPNNAQYNLDGFVLEAGLTAKRRYTFPAGTTLAPNAFAAFFANQTKLGLANSGGQVRLFDPSGILAATTEAYGTAKDGQAWVQINGVWQWTTQPTPGAPNTAAAPAVKAAKTVKAKTAKTAKKVTSKAKKAATKKPAKAKKDKLEPQKTASVAPGGKSAFTPLHPGVLAVAAIFALLYGAYEYRGDLANKFHQLRTNRAARREARRNAEGR